MPAVLADVELASVVVVLGVEVVCAGVEAAVVVVVAGAEVVSAVDLLELPQPNAPSAATPISAHNEERIKIALLTMP
jgi:hypothetical protein